MHIYADLTLATFLIVQQNAYLNQYAALCKRVYITGMVIVTIQDSSQPAAVRSGFLQRTSQPAAAKSAAKT